MQGHDFQYKIPVIHMMTSHYYSVEFPKSCDVCLHKMNYDIYETHGGAHPLQLHVAVKNQDTY